MDQVKINLIKKSIRDVQDFPKKGILFKDLTTAFKDPEILRLIADELVDYYKDKGITKVAGIESRGFVAGSILAHQLDAGFVLIRKPGKLPAQTFSQDYELEYGTDSVEVHKDAFSPDDIVVLHDDLLATGGTAWAAMELINRIGVKKIYLSFIVELGFLKGRDRIGSGMDIQSLINY